MQQSMPLADFKSISLRLASPDEILSWSHGEVTKPETINYRTAKAERDGLFDERIFGPTKDWECYCGKYRRIRFKGIVCDKCGVEVTRAVVRRERMGHIALASPVSHIWFLKGIPSKIGLLLDMSVSDLEKVIYFAGYIITNVDEDARAAALKEIDREFRAKSKGVAGGELDELKDVRESVKKDIRSLRKYQVLSEIEYHRISRKYGEIFEASIGGEAIRNILTDINLEKLERELTEALAAQSPAAQKKSHRRLQIVHNMRIARIRPEWMFLTVIPVIPPDLRPMVQLDGGRFATSDLNDLYRRVINRNNRLRRLFELNAPEVITRNEKRMLQEAVDALIDNSIRRGSAPVASQVQRRPLKSFADILRGKQGRFRQNLLGKRVDYSGRSVIVVGSDLKLHQCGIPKRMALELFKPFVIRKLIERELAHNVRGAGRLIEDEESHVWEALEEVIEGRYVLLNRAPTLHRLGIQAFQPVLIEGNAIQVHPLVCPAFNADFDGDQMAVHLPLTEEAQMEAREIMLSAKNLLKPATGDPVVEPNQDIVLGCYFATSIVSGLKGEGKYFASENEAMLAEATGAIDLRASIHVRISREKLANTENKDPTLNRIETSAGRILFNRTLPADFPFVNKQLKRKDLGEIVARLIKRYEIDATPPILDKIKSFGFEFATKSGYSWGMEDLQIPNAKSELVETARSEVQRISDQYQKGLLTERERYNRIVAVWTDVTNTITGLVPETLRSNGSVYAMVDSRARGTWTQIRQMSGIRGLVVNPAGRIIELPVVSSYKEGLNVLEFFSSTHGARKGTADTALRTSAAGYLTRRLVDVAQDVIVTVSDCGTKEAHELTRKESEEMNKTLGTRAFSRIVARDVKNGSGSVVVRASAIVDDETASLIDDDDTIVSIWVRSPLTCASVDGVCQRCYGYDLGNNQIVRLGEAVGIVAAQAIGEPGTQLTMRTFHTGGVASAGDITTGLPRVQEIFEVRPPKGQAVVSAVSGTVSEITIEDRERIIRILTDPEDRPKGSKSKNETTEYRVPTSIAIIVNVGDKIARGDIITDGHADLKELYTHTDRRTVEHYIITEVQKIYSLQGAPIHDKHIETIVRQMFSRFRIVTVGGTNFNVGEVVERRIFGEENRHAADTDSEPATGQELLLGITRVALSTASFLSAASFQETTRILVDAAIAGREDKLRGLKENVIIGRAIPAGTGYRGHV